MPVVGLNRKAKPSHVYEAIDYGDFPKPKPHETFASFVRRVPDENYIVKVLMALGYGEPDRNEYEYRLSELRDELLRVHHALYEIWRRRLTCPKSATSKRGSSPTRLN